MPRQRKPQNGGQRLWTGRVANTTTGSTTTQTVYRIPTRGAYGECEKLAYEVLGTSPIRVAIEWENIYRISLDEAALKQVIESYDNLDLSNVTLQTINGDVEFTGNVSVDGIFMWQEVRATTISTTDLTSVNNTLTNITSADITTTALTAESASLDNVNVTNNASIWGALWVTWNTTLGGALDVAWDATVWGDVTVTWGVTSASITATTWDITTLTSTDIATDTITVNDAATVINGLTVTWGITSDTLETSWNATIGWNLEVTWTSNFVWDVTTDSISSTGTANLNDVVVAWNETVGGTLAVTWATTLNNSLTVAWASTLSGNTSVGGNLSVAWNETVTGNSTVTGDAIFSSDVSIAEDLNVSWDATITDDLIVNGATHLKTLETTGSVSFGWNLSVDWSIAGWSNLVVENQIESGSLVTDNITTGNITINWNIALWNDATAPDFILQDEKNQPNGVAGLDANGKIDNQYLPPVYTSAIVKIGTWAFSNSDTAVVVDGDIVADSFVIISNYQDIIWDLNETISPGQLTVVSNQVETWSFKYIVVNALPQS